MLTFTEPYNYTSPESYFITALQYISAARESHSIHNIEAMMMLGQFFLTSQPLLVILTPQPVLYNLRSPSNSGIWYMIGLAMRTAIDLGLHREAHYTSLKPYQCQLRRRLFWTVYFLDRIVAVSLGRPVSIADQDIDANMPLDLDESIYDDKVIEQLLARPPHLPRPTSDLTMCMSLIKLKRIESRIQSNIYRVDKSIESLFPEVALLQAQLCEWRNTTPSLTVAEDDYLLLQYNKAIRLLIQPFLTILDPQDDLIRKCLISSGQICQVRSTTWVHFEDKAYIFSNFQVFKRMFQRDSYGHSFISVHSIFIAGVTIWYACSYMFDTRPLTIMFSFCLCINPSLWTMGTANDLSACSSALFVMAERTPSVRKYRDVLETVVSSAMDFIVKSTNPNTDPPPLTREDAAKTAGSFTPHEHQAVESLLGLSSLSQEHDREQLHPQQRQKHPSNTGFSLPNNNFKNYWEPEQSQNFPAAPPPATESIANWPLEPLFDFQWHNTSDPEASFTNGQDNMIWDGMGDLQLPGGSERENVWAGDKHGLNMINKLLGIDATTKAS